MSAATDKAHEEGYLAGSRMAWKRQLQNALSELHGHGMANHDPLFLVGSLSLQLEAARRALRQVCRVYGDNDWPDSLDLSDVIQKHLHQHLDEAQGG